MYTISHLLGSIISNLLLEYAVFLVKYARNTYLFIYQVFGDPSPSPTHPSSCRVPLRGRWGGAGWWGPEIPKVTKKCEDNYSNAYMYIYIYTFCLSRKHTCVVYKYLCIQLVFIIYMILWSMHTFWYKGLATNKETKTVRTKRPLS